MECCEKEEKERINCRICHQSMEECPDENFGYASGFGYYHVLCQRDVEEDV